MEIKGQDLEIRWPRSDDKVFKSSNGTTNAALNFQSDMFWGYLEGFYIAGKSLCERAIKFTGERDKLVYPAIFAYRHFLELAMKQVIQDGNYLLGNGRNWPKEDSHHLDQLWKKCRGVLKILNPQFSDDDLNNVERLINEFMARDPHAIAFRYKEDNGQSELIDIWNLADVMDGLWRFFDSVLAQINQMTIQAQI